MSAAVSILRYSLPIRALLHTSGTVHHVLAVIEAIEANENSLSAAVQAVTRALMDAGATAEQIGHTVASMLEMGFRPERSPGAKLLSGPAWSAMRRRVFEEHRYECAYCLSTEDDLQVDHIVPVSRGGSNDFDNLVPACRTCNASKGDKLLSEWNDRARWPRYVCEVVQ